MNTVRMPGSDTRHLADAKLEPDPRFGEGHLVGEAQTLCGKLGSEWIADEKGDAPLCLRCARSQ